MVLKLNQMQVVVHTSPLPGFCLSYVLYVTLFACYHIDKVGALAIHILHKVEFAACSL